MSLSKSIFVSKTFWLNVLGTVTYVASGQMGFPIPHAPEIMAVLNIVNRFLTSAPVHIAPRP